MKNYDCTEEQFLRDVHRHQLTVLRDDGTYRHIRFKRPDSGAFWFDLITWPGSLCIDGDMGTHVFRRLDDMFRFFRTDAEYRSSEKLAINPGYWGEKLQAIGTYAGFKEFNADFVCESVKRYFDDWVESEEPSEKAKADLWEAIEDDVLFYSGDDPHEFMGAIHNFEHGDFRFADFWETRTEDFTFHFIWCCYAIAWGIKQYDKAAEKVAS